MKYSKYIIAVVCILCLVYFIHPVQSHAAYSYYRAITINAATYNPGSETNFTVLVCANGSSPCNTSVAGLNQSGGGAHVQNSNGYDIIFTSDAGCTTKLNWEMEKYVASTGEMEAWVLISSLGTSNQTIYMCYGNSGISTFQGGTTGTAWDSNYKGIWHLPDGSTLSANDSTSNAVNGTSNGATATTGQIDGGGSFVAASSQYITLGTASQLNVTGVLTISSWINITTLATSFVYSRDFNTTRTGAFGINGAGNVYLESNGGAVLFNGGATSMSTGTWYNIVATYDGTSYRSYINGVLQETVAASSFNSSTDTPSNIGRRPYPGVPNYFDGKIDEVRISNTNRSQNWITTEYNNENSPSTFETFGTESALVVSTAPVHQFVLTGKDKIIFSGNKQIIFQ